MGKVNNEYKPSTCRFGGFLEQERIAGREEAMSQSYLAWQAKQLATTPARRIRVKG